MKTKYLFCKCSGEITRDTLFVDVYVGKSRQDQRDCDFIRGLAKFPQFYFKCYDDQIAEFLYQVGLSLGARPCSGCYLPRRCSLNVNQLRRLLRCHDYDRFAATFVQATKRLSLRLSANDAYFMALSRASNTCKSAHVKNLKPGRIAI